MDDYELDSMMSDDYQEPADIPKFCTGLETAWKLTPELPLYHVLDLIFDGYNLNQLTSEEMQELLDEYILQNQ